GAAGVNGPIVRNILPDFISGTTGMTLWRADDAEPLTPALVADLLQGNLYVNLHTAAFGGGEIRGQLVLNAPGPTPAVTFTANLTGAQEEPSVGVGAL